MNILSINILIFETSSYTAYASFYLSIFILLLRIIPTKQLYRIIERHRKTSLTSTDGSHLRLGKQKLHLIITVITLNSLERSH